MFPWHHFGSLNFTYPDFHCKCKNLWGKYFLNVILTPAMHHRPTAGLHTLERHKEVELHSDFNEEWDVLMSPAGKTPRREGERINELPVIRERAGLSLPGVVNPLESPGTAGAAGMLQWVLAGEHSLG